MEGARAAFLLDGDNLRHGLNGDLGFDQGARSENVRRTAHVARLLAESGSIALVSLVSPYAADREAAAALHREAELRFIEVFVDAPLELCQQRDPKGLYARARAGELCDLTGVGAPYEVPEHPDLVLRSGARWLRRWRRSWSCSRPVRCARRATVTTATHQATAARLRSPP